ncbi:MAG: RNA polymerase sigma factor [Planctomycetes bacterium]|nr:RNA polymerase sigma factor [Planctomycetota bacterium]
MPPESPDPWITTSTVLARLQRFDDRDAWAAFVDRFRLPIQRFARQQGLSEADSEDVAQETLLGFAQAYRDQGFDRSKGRLSHWLFGIAWRRIDHVRRKGQRVVAERTAADDPTAFWAGVPDDAQASAAWNEVWETALMEHCLRRARSEVQAQTYRAFELLVLEKRSVEEVAQELGITKNAVYIAKHRVASRIKELVAELEDGA